MKFVSLCFSAYCGVAVGFFAAGVYLNRRVISRLVRRASGRHCEGAPTDFRVRDNMPATLAKTPDLYLLNAKTRSRRERLIYGAHTLKMYDGLRAAKHDQTIARDQESIIVNRELRELAEGWSAADELKFLWPDDPIKKESDVNEHQ